MTKLALNVRVDENLLVLLKKKAEDENRSLSNLVETLLKQAFC